MNHVPVLLAITAPSISQPVPGLAAWVRMMAALMIICIGVTLSFRLLRRHLPGSSRAGSDCRLVLRQTVRLGRTAHLAAIQYHGSELLLGITEQQITTLDRHRFRSPTMITSEAGEGSLP